METTGINPFPSNPSLKDIWSNQNDGNYPRLFEDLNNETDKYRNESLKHVLSELSIFDKDESFKQINFSSNENLKFYDNFNCSSFDDSHKNFSSKLSIESDLFNSSNQRRNLSLAGPNQDHYTSLFGNVNGAREITQFEDHVNTEVSKFNLTDMHSWNLKMQGSIEDLDFNILVEDLIFLSNKNDNLSRNNLTRIINILMEKKLTKKQYQSLQNVVLEIYRGSNYYADPLQAFYNHELLMMLLKNQSSMFGQVDKRFETSKTTSNLMSSGISLKEEIALLSKSYRNVIGVLESDIEKAAALYRTSANAMAHKKEAVYQWSGILSPLNYKSCQYSRKVFLGGVPWDSTEEDLVSAFIKFGYLSVVFPQNENGSFGKQKPSVNSLRGYCYLIFENEESVSKLTCNCVHTNSGEFYKISSPKFRSKDVQVIPWIINDSQFSRFGAQKPDSKKTVFIGALHGMITSSALAMIMDELFDSVVFTALDTDKYKYPIGSGRVTFSSQKSYMRAVTANFVHVKTSKFNKTGGFSSVEHHQPSNPTQASLSSTTQKGFSFCTVKMVVTFLNDLGQPFILIKIQIDPYLEDSMCNNCFQSPGIYFCRSFECFRYFCSNCWQIWHNRCETLFNHKPLRRTFKPIFESK